MRAAEESRSVAIIDSEQTQERNLSEGQRARDRDDRTLNISARAFVVPSASSSRQTHSERRGCSYGQESRTPVTIPVQK